MAECAYNGTCHACTSAALEYAETDENLVCCVENTSVIQGWLRFIARAPSDCTRDSSWGFVHAGLLMAVGILIMLTVLWFAHRRYKLRGCNPLPVRSPARSVFHRYEQYGRMNAASVDWDEVELDAVVASMEATTAL